MLLIIGSSEHDFFPPSFLKLSQSPEPSFCIFRERKKHYEKSGLRYTFFSQAEDKSVILTSRLTFITWDIIVAFKSHLIHPNVN